MPASSSFGDLDPNNMVTTAGYQANGANTQQAAMGIDDPRALALALEMNQLMNQNHNHDGGFNAMNPFNVNDAAQQYFHDLQSDNKRSQNMTECVGVPSSEHVAEIVGRQGCKIKALRAKTNTYIKTPVRGEEPVFVVTGRKEDVASAKKEILSAADHFSQIRACRKNNMNGSVAPGPPSNVPGQTTISVRVPYRVVGLVVGPKGATIKRIQQTTSTYIVTPSREKEPVFEVTGMPDNVEAARKEITGHIAMRTGGNLDDEQLLAHLAATYNVPVDLLLSNSEVLQCIKVQHQQQQLQQQQQEQLLSNALLQQNNRHNALQQQQSASSNPYSNNIGSASLNVLLSTNAPTQSVGSSQPNFGMSSLSNLGDGGLTSPLSNNSTSTMNYVNSGFGNNAFGNNAFGSSNLTSPNLARSRMQNVEFNPFDNYDTGLNTNPASSTPTLNNFGTSTNIPSTNQLGNLGNFDLLGENAASLFNSQRSVVPESYMSSFSGRNGFGLGHSRSASVVPTGTGFGVDEGLGSLTSSNGSNGSSPPLDQAHIWSNFRMSNKFITDSPNTSPTNRHSPGVLGRRALHTDIENEPQLNALEAALSQLTSGGIMRSAATSPDTADFAAANTMTLASSICSSVLQSLPSGCNSAPITTNAATFADAFNFPSPTNSAAAADKEVEDVTGAEAAAAPSRCSPTQSPSVDLKTECSSCKKVDKLAVTIPCGHNTMCLNCTNKRHCEAGTCHICETTVQSIIQLK